MKVLMRLNADHDQCWRNSVPMEADSEFIATDVEEIRFVETLLDLARWLIVSY